MQLDHERLDVYELALDLLVLANGIIEGLPRGSFALIGHGHGHGPDFRDTP